MSCLQSTNFYFESQINNKKMRGIKLHKQLLSVMIFFLCTSGARNDSGTITPVVEVSENNKYNKVQAEILFYKIAIREKLDSIKADSIKNIPR